MQTSPAVESLLARFLGRGASPPPPQRPPPPITPRVAARARARPRCRRLRTVSPQSTGLCCHLSVLTQRLATGIILYPDPFGSVLSDLRSPGTVGCSAGAVKSQTCEIWWWLPRRMRVTAAMLRIFGDISNASNDCCCTAAAVAPLNPREGLLPPAHTSSNSKKQTLHKANFTFPFLFPTFSLETPPLEKRIFRHANPQKYSRRPSVLDRLKQLLWL